MKYLRALFVLLVLSPNAWADKRVPEKFAAIRQRIQQQLSEQIPSLSLAVAQDGRIIWEEAFGFADLATRTPASESTMYSIASITKPMTATAVMTLVRDGKIALDQPIDRYLGGARLTARIGNAADATVRRVLDHTSGLPVHAQFFFADEATRPPPMPVTIQRYANLITPPGERYVYSNLGYGLLNYVISQTSRVSYADFMQREVFAPLGMKNTSVDIVPGRERQAATRYDRDGTPLPCYDFDHPGASAVFSSAHDVALFGMFHLKDPLRGQRLILTDAQLDTMHRPAAADVPYGLGFSVDDHNGYRVISHSGGMVGVATEMLLIPSEDIAIVALANSATALPFEVAQSIASTLLPHWKPTPLRVERKPPAFVVPEQLAGAWSGRLATWQGDLPVALSFQADGDVHITLGDQLQTLVSGASFEQGRFTGTFLSFIDTADTARYDHVIDLELTLRGNRLTGGAKAAAARSGKRGLRVRNALTSWVELERAALH
ncbi:MAG TPA: serine hydrolase domain-containing protein [Steroidobacter sp.]